MASFPCPALLDTKNCGLKDDCVVVRRTRGGNLGASCFHCGTTNAIVRKVRKVSVPVQAPSDSKRRRGEAPSQRVAGQLVDRSVTPDIIWLCSPHLLCYKSHGFELVVNEVRTSSGIAVLVCRKGVLAPAAL